MYLDGVAFSLSPHAFQYSGYLQYPDVAEKLPAEIGYLMRGGWPTVECEGGHQFVLSRTGD